MGPTFLERAGRGSALYSGSRAGTQADTATKPPHDCVNAAWLCQRDTAFGEWPNPHSKNALRHEAPEGFRLVWDCA
jgi:hypothetical protein